MEQQKKVIVLSCMHGRHETVSYCLKKMPFIDKIMIYSTDEDGAFLSSQDVIASGKYRNNPLSFKWNAAVMSLEQIEFDAVILLGSDDYINEAFIQFVSDNIDGHDMIAFTDLYFESDGHTYYWPGYQNQRKGEPAGAGKVYSKAFLERIKYNLFAEARDRGLDGVSWRRCKQANAKMLITSVRENGLFLCDVKDGKGMTDIKKIDNLELIK